MTQRSAAAETFRGIGILFLCHLALGFVCIVLTFVGGLISSLLMNSLPWIGGIIRAISLYSGLGIGLSQLVYAIPLGRRFKRQRRFNAMKGVIIGAVITTLLNGGCFALLFWTLSQTYL